MNELSLMDTDDLVTLAEDLDRLAWTMPRADYVGSVGDDVEAQLEAVEAELASRGVTL